MSRIIEAGVSPVATTPLNTASNAAPVPANSNTSNQATQTNPQNAAQSKVAAAQKQQQDQQKINFIKQLKELLKRNLGINI
jgi:ribosomal protein L7/L12